MKKIYLFILLIFFLAGCADKTGYTLRYYDECHGEYDAYGVYREVCPHNVIECGCKKDRKCLDCN